MCLTAYFIPFYYIIFICKIAVEHIQTLRSITLILASF